MAESKKPAKKAAVEELPTGNATGLRIGAVILWIVAIGCEVLALLTVIGKLFKGVSSTMRIVIMIGFLVLDLVALIIGSQFWKKSNKIDPASEKNKVKFWLWNNLGVIVAAFAFIPFIILVLLNKDTDKKTKAIASVVAVIALLIGGLTSYDWNPISAEQLQAAKDNIKEEVYAYKGRDIYHFTDCNYIRENNRNDGEIKVDKLDHYAAGEIAKAIEDGHTTLCKKCAKKHDLNNVENLLIEQGKDDDSDAVTEAPADTQG
ncbi:MAG: hypothetical protein IJT70_00540 [Clostridia bacterium]|nr:hypothetical protein [Clostridia bacterium]